MGKAIEITLLLSDAILSLLFSSLGYNRRMADEKNSRQASFEVLNRVSGGAYADIVLNDALEGVAPQDRALATEITYGVLRWQMKLDWAIDAYSTIKTKKLETRVLTALRIGAYQILMLTRIPHSAAVNESVNIIKPFGRKTAGFVNAVLRAMSSQPEKIIYPGREDTARYLSINYSHPEWLVRRWLSRFGPYETEKLCNAGQQVPPKIIRVNTLVTTRDALIKELANEGVDARPTRFSPVGLEIISGDIGPEDKRFYIQDEASQLVPLLLAPKPGQRVLDVCSAPGGKTSLMAELMNNEGEVLALDKSGGRLKSVDALMKRLGVKIVKTMEADAEKPLAISGPFDAILVDAPCSGLGVLRRAPDIKYTRKEKDIIELSRTQRNILENAKGHLKKGGHMVYSVCTMEPEETDLVVKTFLEKNPEFRTEEARIHLPNECGQLANGAGLLRTFPQRDNMDGFFAARFFRMADKP